MFTLQSNQIANALRLADIPASSAKDLVQAFTNCAQYLEQRGPVGLTYTPANTGLFPTQQPAAWGANPNRGGNSTIINRNVTVNIPPWQNIPFTPLPFVDIPAGAPFEFSGNTSIYGGNTYGGDAYGGGGMGGGGHGGGGYGPGHGGAGGDPYGIGGAWWPGGVPSLNVPGPVQFGPVSSGPISSTSGNIGGVDMSDESIYAPGDTYIGGDTYVDGDTYIGGDTNINNVNVGGNMQVGGNADMGGPVTNETVTHNYGDTNIHGPTNVLNEMTVSRGPTKIYGPTYVNSVPLERRKLTVLTDLALSDGTLTATKVVLTCFGQVSVGTPQNVFTVATGTQNVPTTFDPETCTLGGEQSITYVSGLNGA